MEVVAAVARSCVAVARSCAAVAKSWFNRRGDGGVKADVGAVVRTYARGAGAVAMEPLRSFKTASMAVAARRRRGDEDDGDEDDGPTGSGCAEAGRWGRAGER